MKKLLFLFLVLIVLIACNKDENDDGPMVVTSVEYRIDTSVDGPMIKYINAQGDETIDYLSDSAVWVYRFPYNMPLDSVGFKIKDFMPWVSYKIILNTDTVVNYTGPVPQGGFAGWYGVYYYMP
jgi:hypothetical protein